MEKKVPVDVPVSELYWRSHTVAYTNTYGIVDSTALEGRDGPDAGKGKTSKGWFKGFKLHVGISQLKIPVRAVPPETNMIHQCCRICW